MARATLDFEGFNEVDELFNQMVDDIGEKDAKGLLRKAVKKSMQPVLQVAKILAPVDTGALVASLQVEARKPTRKDKRSKYVEDGDTVISNVTTAPGYKLSRLGIKSDARAVANEFGTANMPAKPFMRPAMESQSETVLAILGSDLKQELERYKARQARRLARAMKG